MDPNAALKQLVEACTVEDRERALDALGGLCDWVSGGGFLPTEAALELTGQNARILVMAEDVPEGADFTKKYGSVAYRRIGRGGTQYYLETTMKVVYGVSDYGAMTDVDQNTHVWVRPPLDWKNQEVWTELMTKYAGYDPESDGNCK